MATCIGHRRSHGEGGFGSLQLLSPSHKEMKRFNLAGTVMSSMGFTANPYIINTEDFRAIQPTKAAFSPFV